jgi:hypothetical protein
MQDDFVQLGLYSQIVYGVFKHGDEDGKSEFAASQNLRHSSKTR